MKQMANVLKTSNGNAILSIQEPEALVPQFQLLVKLAQLRKQSGDIAKLFAADRESTTPYEGLASSNQRKQNRCI